MQKKQKARHKQSFTLIELLVVIAIIAILAAVIIANVTSAQAQARDVRRTQDLDQLRTALEMYYFDHNSYPYPTNSDQGFCIEQNQSFKTLLIDGDYISSLPQDPLYNSSQCTDPSNTDCHCYIYRTETADKYKLFAKVEQQDFKPAKQDGGISDIYYEAYSPAQGSNQIVLGWAWYEAGPYLSGIVGAWSFDEGAGTTAFDTSGNNNNGTLINGPIWVDGKFGKALSFDGVNDYVVANGVTDDLGPLPFTVSAWVKPKSMQRGVPFSFHFNGNNRNIFFWAYNNVTAKFYHYHELLTLEYVQTSDTFSTDQWYHVVWEIESNAAGAIYVNGNQQATWLNSDTRSINQFSIGQEWDDAVASDFFNGLIDEVHIYNRALTADEIAALYSAGGN